MEDERITIGLIEEVILEDGKTYLAKIDTGADSSSVDKSVAESLGDKPIIAHKYIRSALGRDKRPIISVDISIRDLKCTEEFTISDRKNLKYKILIGKDIMRKERFLVDPLIGVDQEQQIENQLNTKEEEVKK